MRQSKVDLLNAEAVQLNSGQLIVTVLQIVLDTLPLSFTVWIINVINKFVLNINVSCKLDILVFHIHMLTILFCKSGTRSNAPCQVQNGHKDFF
jgi:hypothetical protein